jgi:hypothetical protein
LNNFQRTKNIKRMDTTVVKKNIIDNFKDLELNSNSSTIKYYGEFLAPPHLKFIWNTPPSSTGLNDPERYQLSKIRENLRKLDSFLQFGSNWHGYESQGFSTDLILKVKSILRDLEYQPQVFPTGRGTIQLEKWVDDDNLVEIEISEDEIFAYKVTNGEESESIISVDEINKILF